MNKTLIFHDDYIEVDDGYVCSREQAKAILGQWKANKYTQDTPLAGSDSHCDLTTYKVRRFKSGRINIGCLSFPKNQLTRIRKWLKNGAR